MSILKSKKNKPLVKLLSLFIKKKRYKDIGNVGSGGIADIKSTFDSQLNRVVACKILQKKSFDNEHLLKAFIREARLMSFLDHPGIVPIYDAFIGEDGRPCYTMKLVEGMRLSSFLKYRTIKNSKEKTPLSRQLDIFTKICETLAYAHSQGVIHLDIKPDNILLGKYGEVLVLDWGNARLFNSEKYDHFFKMHIGNAVNVDIEKDISGIILGTPDYMSPEQTNCSREYLTPASDIFSAGIILYQMLTGEQPFSDMDDTREIMSQIRSFSPREIHEINTEIPLKLSEICMRMLHKNPKKRYNSFDEILTEFSQFYNSGEAFGTEIFQASEIIIHENEIGNHSLKILSGRVEVSKVVDGVKKVIAELGDGEIFGELAIFSNQPRNATIVALEETEIRVMDRKSVEKELEKLSPWVGSMVKSLSERFIELNNEAAKYN